MGGGRIPHSRSGGTPSQIGVPYPRCGGYPIQDLGGVIPHPRLGDPISGMGVPHPRSGWGVLHPKSGSGEYPIPGLDGGGTPSQVWGVPHPRSGWGVPGVCPSKVWMVGGTPSKVWMEYLPTTTMTGWGISSPTMTGWGTPHHHDWMSNPPTLPIRQNSIASTCYTVGGMPLAFMQEDFLFNKFFSTTDLCFVATRNQSNSNWKNKK